MRYTQPPILDDCPLLPEIFKKPGRCARCQEILCGRRSRWCSDLCSRLVRQEFAEHHDWTTARIAAKERDQHQCVKCGAGKRSGAKLSVDHIDPLRGRGYGRSCMHHQANLQTLCAPCHREKTNADEIRFRSLGPLFFSAAA